METTRELRTKELNEFLVSDIIQKQGDGSLIYSCGICPNYTGNGKCKLTGYDCINPMDPGCAIRPEETKSSQPTQLVANA